MIKIHKTNETKIYIEADYDQAVNINEHFSFYAPNYFWNKKYRAGLWSGKIYLFNFANSTLPIGLLDALIKFLKDNNTEFEVEQSLLNKGKKLNSVSIIKFANQILKCELVPHDFQIQGVQLALYHKKTILLSATASGKSYILFLIINLLKYFNENFKFLLVVPSTNLVEQMTTDFCEYGKQYTDYSNYIHKIYGGKDKNTDKVITISTWQSLMGKSVPAHYFQQFDCVIVDECHGAKAAEITGIMEKSVNAEYKIGVSGTIKNSVMDKLQLVGLFGNVYKISSSAELIKRGLLSKLNIIGIILKYPDEIRKYCKEMIYNDEIAFINNDKNKIKTVCKLAISRKNNTLILFKTLTFGKLIYKLCKKNSTKKVYYIAGEVDTETREKIRKITETRNDIIIVASYGTFAQGINIKNLHNIVFAQSMKSFIKVIQSIGRLLRKHDSKDCAILYDITEDLSWKSHKNYTLKHFFDRIGYYDQEKFNYTVREISIK